MTASEVRDARRALAIVWDLHVTRVPYSAATVADLADVAIDLAAAAIAVAVTSGRARPAPGIPHAYLGATPEVT